MLTEQPLWKALQTHRQTWDTLKMRDLFETDPDRFKKYHHYLLGKNLLFDYSKNRITDETLSLLFKLARARDLEEKRDAMFRGDPINFTEGRAVLHTALRYQGLEPMEVGGHDVRYDARAVLARMATFVNRVHEGSWRGAAGDMITDIVNIGIGGSDLGPAMVAEALHPYRHKRLRAHFVSNVDGADIFETLKPLNPATTLFLVASKTFTTQETMMNAHSARRWLVGALGEAAVSSHFAALSVNVGEAERFGIQGENVYPFWDWVGGRYSLWSAIGLSIMLLVGRKNFKDLLKGAYEIDEHFRTTPLEKNVPVIMGLLGLWYINFFDAETHAVLPYDQRLRRFPAYLQQADMESNGKSVTRNGAFIQTYRTGPVVFGEPGTNGQHSFYQLIHQGRHFIPCDFIAFAETYHPYEDHHTALLSNFFAQTEALMRGKSEAEVRADLGAAGKSLVQIDTLWPHLFFEGNRPSNSFLIKKLTPRTLGALIALYEHKIFVQGALWDINSYDQWGVQLGKHLAKGLLSFLEAQKPATPHDSSTQGLLAAYKAMKES